MSIGIVLRCNGCTAVATYDLPPVEIAPHGCSLARVTFPKLRDCGPAGWVAYDPWTYLTYCPACMASIESPDRADRV